MMISMKPSSSKSSHLLVVILLFAAILERSMALSPQDLPRKTHNEAMHRRHALKWITASATSATLSLVFAPSTAQASADCYSDCFKNCKTIAPKDLSYCQDNCKDYCAQDDRKDGLSGSVSASGGETGILGGTFGQGTVPKGEDKPPSINLPGLDFTSGQGRKLLGY